MKEYIMTLIAVTALSAVIGMLAPSGDVKKYIRFACALCLICAMIAPLSEAFGKGGIDIGRLFEYLGEDQEINYDEIYNEALMLGNKENIEKSLKHNISTRFNIEGSSFNVIADIELKNDIYEINKVTVYLRESAIFADPQKIISYINDEICCECVIIYE